MQKRVSVQNYVFLLTYKNGSIYEALEDFLQERLGNTWKKITGEAAGAAEEGEDESEMGGW